MLTIADAGQLTGRPGVRQLLGGKKWIRKIVTSETGKKIKKLLIRDF
jgi:hypothetical protein